MSKRSPSLSIPKPCSENWDNMQASSQGAFCKTCAVEVIDFTKMTNEEILDYLQKRKNERVCGKINTAQLEQKKIRTIPSTNLYSRFRKILLSFFIGLSLTPFAKAQNNTNENYYEASDSTDNKVRLIKGIVRNEENEAQYGVSIRLYHKEELLKSSSTDFDGKFELPIPANIAPTDLEIVFQFIGMEDTIIQVLDKHYYEVVLKEEVVFIGTIEVKEKQQFKPKWKKLGFESKKDYKHSKIKKDKGEFLMGCPSF